MKEDYEKKVMKKILQECDLYEKIAVRNIFIKVYKSGIRKGFNFSNKF